MSFRDVHVLWALACLPLAWLAAWHAQRRRQQARAHFSALGFWASTAPPGLRRIGVLLAWSVAWALLVLAAAGPRFGTEPRKLKVRGVDVVWLLDVSKSMWADDVKPSRLARAKAEMRQWLSASAGHRVGVVAFAGQAVTFPLTMDLEAVRLFIEELGPQDMPVGGTDFAVALEAAQALWTGAGERRARALIVLSDGEDHAGALDAALARLRAQGVQVFVLGVGTRVGAPVPARMVAGKPQGHVRDRRGQVVISRLGPAEQRTLRQLAGSKGHYVALSRARSGSAWVQARLAGLRQQAAQLARRNLQQDRYRWALIPALLWWLLESLWPLLCWLMACLRPKRSGMHA